MRVRGNCRLISVETCTIAIANLNDVPLEYLPVDMQEDFPASDAANYVDVRDALAGVLGTCLYGRDPSVGFAVLGEWLIVPMKRSKLWKLITFA